MNPELYRRWIEKPDINPLTGRRIKINGPTYNKYKEECDSLGITRTVTPENQQSKEHILQKIRDECYNTADPITMEEFEDMTEADLRSVIMIGDGEKKHAFLQQHIKKSVTCGNLNHPVTNMPLSKRDIKIILKSSVGIPYEITFEYVGNLIQAKPLRVFLPEDGSEVAQVYLYELSQKGITPKKYAYRGKVEFRKYVKYLEGLFKS